MFNRYEQRCFIKIQVARGRNASQCFRALQEAYGREVLPYRTMQDRWKPSVMEESNVNAEHMLVDPLLQQTVSMFRLYGFYWKKTDGGHVWRFPGNLVLQCRLHIPFKKKADRAKSFCPLGSAHCN